MKVTAEIKVKKELEIQTKGITLLSLKEFEDLKPSIPPLNRWWWLRSPCEYSSNASFVYIGGNSGACNNSVNASGNVVRPALILDSSSLNVGDRFEFGNHTFTVISEKYALCDDSIGKPCFRKDWKAKDANNYETSDVKKYVEDWYEKALEIQKEAEEEEDRDEI